MKTQGLRVVWGIPTEIKPVVNAPPGKQRLRFRAKECGRVFIKTAQGTRAEGDTQGAEREAECDTCHLIDSHTRWQAVE